MIDLEKEFRTLKLGAQALIIIGAGLAIGSAAVALFVGDSKKAKQPPVVVAAEDAEATTDADQPPPPPRKQSKDYSSIVSSYTRQLSIPAGILGLVFLVLGGALLWFIRNNIDEKDDTEPSQELYKAY